MSSKILISLALGFATFILFISLTDNTAQGEFFFCVFMGVMVGVIAQIMRTTKSKDKR